MTEFNIVDDKAEGDELKQFLNDQTTNVNETPGTEEQEETAEEEPSTEDSTEGSTEETTEENPFVFKYDDKEYNEEQLTEKFKLVADSAKKFEDGYSTIEKLTPLLEAVDKGNVDESIKILKELVGASTESAQKDTTSKPKAGSKDSELAERVAALEAEKAQAVEDSKMNEAFDTAASKFGEEFTKAEPELIQFMIDNKLHWSQIDVAFNAFTKGNTQAAKKKTDAKTLLGNKKQTTTTGNSKVWAKEGESAWETAQRLKLKLD